MTSNNSNSPLRNLGPGVPGLVSIVIPTYRRPVEVRQAVLSAIAQTYTAIEIIVVSDGPDPATRAAVQDLDPRVRYAELPVNRGPAEARNQGVEMSRGEWLAFLDDDDLLLPEKTGKQLAIADIDRPRRMIACRAIYRAQGKDNVHPDRPIGPEEDISDYILLRPSLTRRPGVLSIQSLLMHRSLLEQLPFESHADHEDWAWLINAWHIAGARIEFLWEPLVVYNIVVDSISRSRRVNWKDSLNWALEHRRWIGNRAMASFLSTKVALKAKRSGERGALASVTRLFFACKPGLLEIAFLCGAWLLPGRVLHHLWKRSLHSPPPASSS